MRLAIALGALVVESRVLGDRGAVMRDWIASGTVTGYSPIFSDALTDPRSAALEPTVRCATMHRRLRRKAIGRGTERLEHGPRGGRRSRAVQRAALGRQPTSIMKLVGFLRAGAR